MKVIGFAGTAKNTGKTTTASKVLSILRDNGSRVAVTSIGYDGENIDNVTGLPKPLYYMKAGDIIATASQCLNVSKSSTYKILESTGIQTILGEIQIVEILENKTYTLAGPNRRTDVEKILQKLISYKVDYALIDGALNRIVPVICADGIVISTGAAFDEDIHSTALHAEAIANLFTFPLSKNVERHKNIHIQLDDGESVSIHSSSLITQDNFEKIQSALSAPRENCRIRRLTIPGACYPDLLLKLIDSIPQDIVIDDLVLGNPLFLIASGNPITWKKTLAEFIARGIKVGYSETLPLMFITVNPFYPRYIQNAHTYEAAYVDAELILKEIASKITGIPVINVQDIQNQELFTLLN